MNENAPDRRDERLDVLKQLPPLMPRFLKRRRSMIPEVGEAIQQLSARLDLDRPTFFALVELHELQGGYGWQPITESKFAPATPTPR